MSRRSERRASLIVRNLPLDTRFVRRAGSRTGAAARPGAAQGSPRALRRRDEVQDIFAEYGRVKDVYLPLNHYTRYARTTLGHPAVRGRSRRRAAQLAWGAERPSARAVPRALKRGAWAA